MRDGDYWEVFIRYDEIMLISLVSSPKRHYDFILSPLWVTYELRHHRPECQSRRDSHRDGWSSYYKLRSWEWLGYL